VNKENIKVKFSLTLKFSRVSKMHLLQTRLLNGNENLLFVVAVVSNFRVSRLKRTAETNLKDKIFFDQFLFIQKPIL